jgi:hypothetical protein
MIFRYSVLPQQHELAAPVGSLDNADIHLDVLTDAGKITCKRCQRKTTL